MKKFFKITVSIILTLSVMLLTLTYVSADTIYVYNGYSYTLMDGDYISVCGWDNSDESLVIPDQLDGSYIKEIADLGFRYNTYITSLDMSPAIYMNRIGNMAFKGCTGLTGNISVPARMTDVGIAAFQDCSSIQSVNYYAETYSVPTQCFYLCSSLKYASIAHGVKEIDKLAFAGCGMLGVVRIPATVEYINPTAFDGCENLTIYCYTGTAAHQFAIDSNIDFVLIDAPAPTEPPTEPVTDAPSDPATEPPTDAPDPITYVLGDADGDGMVTILDATKIQRILVDLDTDDDGMITLRSLVDGADTLNIMHATKIQRWIAGFKTDDPIGEIVTG